MSHSYNLSHFVHVIPNFAAIVVDEEAVDLVVEVLQLERISAWHSARIRSFFVCPTEF